MAPIPVLVLCDDLWHPGEVVRRGLLSIPQGKYAFDFVYDAKDILSPAFIRKFPLIINCKCNQLNSSNNHEWFEPRVAEVMPDDLEAYVRSGGGYLALHGGLAWYKDDTTGMLRLNGCYFVQHPPRCEIGMEIVQPEHPVARGVQPFTARDEHYEIAMTCDDADIFLRSRSENGGDQVAGYTRLMGEGRICALTLGHILSAWEHPEYQKLLLNAMEWCIGE